ncbi:MAG: DUF4416 family protein [Sedimentisphaerales bacterium]|nr:DUF4416 family protein [Sedimentisphaerales bacterium]
MGQTKEPDSVALIVGMLSMRLDLFDLAAERMQALWGPIALQSDVMPFDATDYYTRQMGPALRRKFVAFARLIDPGQLAAIKHQSNALEDRIARCAAGRALGVDRPINLDPGYVEPSKLVLATTKNYSHRIYIGKSMYAESTLRYHQGRWQGWPYTYPDYAGGAYDDFLTRVRDFLMQHRAPAPTTPAGPTTDF